MRADAERKEVYSDGTEAVSSRHQLKPKPPNEAKIDAQLRQKYPDVSAEILSDPNILQAQKELERKRRKLGIQVHKHGYSPPIRADDLSEFVDVDVGMTAPITEIAGYMLAPIGRGWKQYVTAGDSYYNW